MAAYKNPKNLFQTILNNKRKGIDPLVQFRNTIPSCPPEQPVTPVPLYLIIIQIKPLQLVPISIYVLSDVQAQNLKHAIT